MSSVTLYRPVGTKELKLIEAAGWKAFPPRLPEQPIFYPVVPMNSPRIRITLIATLTDEDIEHALRILEEVGREVGVLA